MAPRRFSPESQCIGKQRYPRKADAKVAARRVERHFGRMHAYRCVHCGHFHIGHKPPRDLGRTA